MISWTTFVGGDSYTSSGMSTRTGVIDTSNGTFVPSIEHFRVTLDGKPYRAADVNYWGVSFADDDNTFYATLATKGERYLVRGDFAKKSVETLASNVECPSISPDGTRLAFKEAIDDDPLMGWRVSVFDLATKKVTHLSETRTVDDQPAWLDDDTVAYTWRGADGVPSIWSVPADGTGRPTKLADNAESPAPLG
jgi:Tol biopolymer transport system component